MLDITNKTWEDVFKEIILTHGQIGIIIVVGIIALLLGGGIVWFYLTKFKYVSVNTKLDQLKQEKGQLVKNLDEANNKINNLKAKVKELETEIQDVIGCRFVREAIKPDTQDAALKVFVRDNDNANNKRT